MEKLPKLVVGACALAALGGIFLLAGCTEFEVAERGMDFNTALEDHDNEQILINIVRESMARPLYFSAITQVATSGVFDHSQLQLGIPVGPVGAKKWTVQPTLGLQEGIGVTLAPLDTSDFWNPMINPTNAGEFLYYMKYGWATEVVIAMFVDRVTMTPQQFAALRVAAEKIESDKRLCAGDFYDGRFPPSQPNLPRCFEAPNDAQLKAMAGACDPTSGLAGGGPASYTPATADAPVKRLAFTNAVPRPGYTQDEVCRFYRFQYFAQILAAFADRFEVAQVPQGAVATPGAMGAAPSAGGGSGSKGGGSGSGGSSSGGGAGGTAAAYRLEIRFDDKAGAGGAPACRWPKEMARQAAALQRRLSIYPQQPSDSSDQKGELASLQTRIAALVTELGSPDHPNPVTPKKLDFVTAPLGEAPVPPTPVSGLSDFETAVTQLEQAKQDGACDTAELPTMLLNSTENMLYELGQVLLADDGSLHGPSGAPGAPTDPCRAGSPFVPAVFTRWVGATPNGTGSQAEFQPLFVVCKAGQGSASSALSVKYDNETYFIPQDTKSRTMSVLQLVQQLVALQKSSSLLLPVPTVRVLGQ